MSLDQDIAEIERCEDIEQLNNKLQSIVNQYGFSSYCFLDLEGNHQKTPYYTGTTGVAWEEEYSRNGFVTVDECLKLALRSNRFFSWDQVPIPERLGKRRPGAQLTFDAARDHGFKQGLVVPFHYVDDIGRTIFNLCTLFWKDDQKQFQTIKRLHAYELHLLLIYWMSRSTEVRAMTKPLYGNVMQLATQRESAFELRLTDRERDVLSWASRGKTTDETAQILGVSYQTAESYVRKATEKLCAGNKTHAVAKSIMLGLIEP